MIPSMRSASFVVDGWWWRRRQNWETPSSGQGPKYEGMEGTCQVKSLFLEIEINSLSDLGRDENPICIIAEKRWSSCRTIIIFNFFSPNPNPNLHEVVMIDETLENYSSRDKTWRKNLSLQNFEEIVIWRRNWSGKRSIILLSTE